MSAYARAALGVSVLLFLVVGDVWFPRGSPWLALRVPLLAAGAAASLVLVALRPSLLRPLARPPLIFFVAFAALDLLAGAMAEHPLLSLRYAFGYFVVVLTAAVVGGVFSDRVLMRGLTATLVVKIALSLAFVSQPWAWWFGRRLQGGLGSPNPMGATAGLAYLLLLVQGWYDWRTPAARAVQSGAGLAATVALALTHSVSAAVATVGTLAVAAPLGRLRKDTWKARFAWLAVAAALLAPLVLVGNRGAGQATGRMVTPTRALELRLEWWGMLVPVVLQRPWFGYGAGSTAALAVPGSPQWGTSAHNLYLEAAIYAGIPAALAMLLFVAAAVFMSSRRALGEADAARTGVAAVLIFYAVLSLVEPVVLNGMPSSLLVPLVAAAMIVREDPGGHEGRR